MAGERFVALGVAQVRSAWFKEVARWATSAALPLEFVKCMTIDELRARLGSGRPFSVLLADGSLPGVDRDLVETAREAGCAVVVIDDGRVRRDWQALGVSVVLSPDFSRADIAAVLESYAVRIGRGDTNLLNGAAVPEALFGARRGRVVAVTGAGGTGASVAAMALAQGLAADSRTNRGPVVLADLALDADQAMLHHSVDVIPGIQELVDAHRARWLEPGEVITYTFALADRGYHLLLGLRRHRDWVTIRPRAFEAALDGLRRTFGIVVTDIDPDLEGEDQCGSIDVEERNLMARTAARGADVVVVVAAPGLQGSHRLVRIIDGLVTAGVGGERILPVFNNVPRGGRLRAEHTRMVAELVQARLGGKGPVAPPVFLPARRNLDDALRDAIRLPGVLANPLAAAVVAVLARTDALAGSIPDPSMPFLSTPAPVVPGSLSTWTEEEALS
jgi:hypothetical protein